MAEKNYPEEIYPKLGFKTDALGRLTYRTVSNSDFELAYDLGYEHGKQAQGDLTGWSNLTEAIKAGEPIDWGALDGLEAKCVHHELGTLTHKLERDDAYSPEDYFGWYKEVHPDVWGKAFHCSWLGLLGWVLYIKGDVPLRKLIADELKPGTIFEAVLTDEEEFGPVALLRVDAGIIDMGDWQALDADLTCIEVSRVLGTLDTPDIARNIIELNHRLRKDGNQ